jgi:hypothetical protein
MYARKICVQKRPYARSRADGRRESPAKATAFEAKRMEDERIFEIISAIVLEEEVRAA